MSKLKTFLIILSIISIIVFIGSVIYFISPPTLKQITDVESIILFGEKSPDLIFTAINNISYKDLININNATKIFDKSIARYNDMLIISDAYSTANILPDSIPYNELIIEMQIENINNGLNVSLKGNTTIPKGYQGHFYFNSSNKNWLVFDDNSKFNFSWQYSLTSHNVITVKTTENATDIIETNVIEKSYTNYKSLDVVFDANKGLLFSKEAFLDPDISACGSIGAPGYYTLTTPIVNSTVSCITINSSHVDFSCNNLTIDGVYGSYQKYGITNIGSKANATNHFTNVSIHDCYLTDWDSALNFAYINNSYFNNIVTSRSRPGTGYGLSLSGDPKNLVVNNLSVTSGGMGLANLGGGNISISNSYVSGTDYGILMGFTISANPYLVTNVTAINVSYGVRFAHAAADKAVIYNNFFNVTTAYALVTAGADNYFNTTNITGTNIVGGANIGGNFWANKTGGYSETCIDANSDGFCDSRFNVTSGLACPTCTGFNIDFFPLAKAPSLDNYPTFSNIITNPINNSYYSPNVYYQFNSTITNSNGTGGIGFNGVNYTAANATAIFNTSVFNLGAGTYSYYWWAYGNGASHYFNTTALYDYVINKTVPSMIVTMNPGTSFAYGTGMSIAGENCPSQLQLSVITNCSLSRKNISITNPDTTLLGVGTYRYIFNTSGNANYTNFSASDILTITQIDSTTTLTFNATSPQLYPNQIIPTCTLTTGQGTPTLKANGNIITSGNAILLSAGSNNFNCSIGNTQNYTGSSDSYDFVINQGTPSLTLEILPGVNVIDGTETNATGKDCPPELTCYLARNNVTVNNSDIQTLAIGSYQYIFNTSGNINYSAFSIQGLLTVNASFDLEYPKFSNYWDDNNSIEYNGTASFNVTLFGTNGTVFLHINGTIIEAANITADVYNTAFYFNLPGTYNYNWSSYGNGTEQHLNYSTAQSYTVRQDSTLPEINLIAPLNNLYSLNITQNFTANFSDIHGLKNATLYIYNSSGIFNLTSFDLGGSNQILNRGTMVYNLADNQYNWSYRAFDNAGNSFTTLNWTFTIDTTNPIISYGTGTAGNYANVSQNWIYINTSWTEPTFANITFSLFNDTNIINSTVFTTPAYFINWTNLANGNYSYQVNITDLLNHIASTEIRFIMLDFTLPNATLISPANGSLNRTTTQNFTVNASDNYDLKNATLYIYNQTGVYNISTTNITGRGGIIGWVTNLIDGVYTWFVEVFDKVGNKFRTGNYTLTIDTTPPYFTDFNNKTIYNDEALSYVIGASDAMTSVSCFTVNNTYNFSINCAGLLTSDLGLELGINYLNITVNDSLNNLLSGVLWISVLNSSIIPTEPFTWYNNSEDPNNRLFAISESGDVIMERNGSIQRRRVATKIWIGETGNTYTMFNESA